MKVDIEVIPKLAKKKKFKNPPFSNGGFQLLQRNETGLFEWVCDVGGNLQAIVNIY